MSWNPSLEPQCPNAEDMDSIETLIVPRARDLGGFEVRRALPAPRRQMVGPFIFFDQMGPAEFIDGGGIDVRPHPHIGIGTVTYLYQGEFQHRDSVGSNQMIYPGEVNWMVAGHGVTHSERTSDAAREGRNALFGIQTWVALPESAEETGAAFEHHDKEALPFMTGEGKEVRLILGNAWGERAPVSTFSEMFYADAVLAPGAKLPMPDNHEDRGAYVVGGEVSIAGDTFEAGRMMVFRPGDAITLTAGPNGTRLMLLGGETLNGPRYIWWNFVASSQDKIEAAKQSWAEGDWDHGRFKLPPGDTDEFIPLPEKR
ncbi:MAG: pirin family protein [Rhodobacteraceae bacterium]|nr:pirin family protein [Paracoccaceae bacterium]